MKFWFLLLSITCLATQVHSQDSDFKKVESENEPEKKSGLEKMISDRNFPFQDQDRFGIHNDNMKAFRNGSPQQLTANWSYVDASGNLYDDVGRTNSITIDTINNGRFYICTPHSGVWITNNNGATYTPITESLPTQNISSLLIDYSNTNTLYLATGTFQMDMPANSMGVFKSTDGGSSWNPTGLIFAQSDEFSVGDLIINPLNNNSVLAATTDGLYRTYDAGATWTKIIMDVIYSVRFKPGDTSMIYAAGPLNFYRSDNAGVSFNNVSSGISNTFQWHYINYVRTIAAFPNIVYLAIAGLNVNPNFSPVLYVHKSTDNGQTFTITDTLAVEPCVQFDVSQFTEDRFVAGYRNTYKKENASTPFTLLTQWNYPLNPFYMHPDQRGMTFDPRNDSTIYFCNDGGLYRMINNINSAINITSNMQLAHLYNFALSDSTDYKILVATLDVSPYIIGNSGISQTFPQFAEAFAAHMSPLNDDIYCMSHYLPGFTMNDGNSFYYSTHFLINNGFYNSDDFQYDKCQENVCYFSSYNDIHKSTDYGVNFGFHVQTTYNPYLSWIRHPEGFEVCRANPRRIYVYYIDSVYVSNDAGTMLNISAGLPVGQAAISDLAVDPANENNAWISFSGYTQGIKVFYTNNAGQTWIDVSNGIPNVPVNTLVCQEGVPGAVYAGTDGGVFYIDDTFSSWQYYSTNLPNVIITDLEIQQSLQKLRVATFGRGVWESDLYQQTPANYVLPPVALFISVTTHVCPNESVSLMNISCGSVDSVTWLFPGGIPATSTSNNPVVTWSAPGNYSVTMIAYNSGGTDTLTLVDYITVNSSLSLPYYEPVANLNAFVLPAGSYTTEVNFDGATWNRGWWTDGSSGLDDDFIYYDNFNHNLNGLEERFVFPTMDLAGTIEPKLFFYRSYQRKDAVANDTLVIYVKPCGGNEVAQYVKSGAQLANIPGFNSSNYWNPTQPSDWQPDSVDLTPFAGQQVTISFGDIGYGGQVIYIDEFRVMETNTTGINENQNNIFVSVFPNPVNGVLHIRTTRETDLPLIMTDLTGRIIFNDRMKGTDTSINMSGFADGIYFLQVSGQVRKIEKFSK